MSATAKMIVTGWRRGRAYHVADHVTVNIVLMSTYDAQHNGKVQVPQVEFRNGKGKRNSTLRETIGGVGEIGFTKFFGLRTKWGTGGGFAKK